MFFSSITARVRETLFQVQTRDAQNLARVTAYLGALR